MTLIVAAGSSESWREKPLSCEERSLVIDRLLPFSLLAPVICAAEPNHLRMMTNDWITILNFGCWIVCYVWMHRISSRQNAVLDQLSLQAQRIEEISRQEHAILSEVHPNVEAIQKDVGKVSEKVAKVEHTVAKHRG